MLLKSGLPLVAVILGSWLTIAGQPNSPVIDNRPGVIDELESIEILSITEAPGSQYGIELRNVSNRDILGIFVLNSRCFDATDPVPAGGPIMPGETRKLSIYRSCGPDTKMEFLSILFQDGTCEGEAGGCARLEARREAKRLAALLQLPILKQAAENRDRQQVLGALRRVELDGQTVNKLIGQLAFRYPGSIDMDWQNVTEDFSREFRSYRDGLRQNIEDTFRFGGNVDPAGWIWLMKRCEEILAQPAFSGLALTPRRRQASATRHREAYDAWMKATFEIDISFWLSGHRDSPTFRPLVNLMEIGPNIAPFLVNELRNERDEKRLHRLCTLIGYLPDIDVLRGKRLPLRGSFQEAYPASREQFLADWDAGIVTGPTESLRIARRNIDEDKPVDKFDYQGTLGEVRSSGVYALPFIVETLKQHNSEELFAAFLAVTAQYDLYSLYCKAPREFFVSQPEKIGYVQAWFKANEHRINELTQVHAKLKKLLAE